MQTAQALARCCIELSTDVCQWPYSDTWLQLVSRWLQVPILFNLSEPQRFQLAQRMVQRDVAAGEVVFRQGDQGARPRRCRRG